MVGAGNPAYSHYFSALVEDWVGHLPCRKGVSRTGWDAPGGAEPCATGTMESPWRVLEAGIRTASTWAPAFFGMQQASTFVICICMTLASTTTLLHGSGWFCVLTW